MRATHSGDNKCSSLSICKGKIFIFSFKVLGPIDTSCIALYICLNVYCIDCDIISIIFLEVYLTDSKSNRKTEVTQVSLEENVKLPYKVLTQRWESLVLLWL